MRIARGLLILFIGMLHYHVVYAAKLDAVSVQQTALGTIIHCKITGQFQHKLFVLHQPERTVVDLSETNTTINPKTLTYDHRDIALFRIGTPSPGVLRMVFDLKKPMIIYKSSLIGSSKQALELRIELRPNNHPPTSVRTTSRPTSAVQTRALRTTNTTSRISHKREKPGRDVVIVLDPGHGGKDPGARGPRHNYEKDIVLSVALRLKQLLDRQPGMRAVLTRRGDYYLGLRQRLDIARKQNADIFVSIHADAFINQHSNGASVFALSSNGATSEAARWLAEKENYSELGGVDLSELNDQSGLVRTVLIDLSQTATINSSLRMGNKVLNNLDKMTTLHTGRVEQARFVVLKSPDIPSILIETGFISNPREENNLTNPHYQGKLTQAILDGIKSYFVEYPPHGTRLEAMYAAKNRLARL